MNNLLYKKQQLIDLIDRKIKLITNLMDVNKKIASLDAMESEESISRFSINSLHDLHCSVTNKLVEPLNTKSDLKKSCITMLEELDILDNTIYTSVVDLMIEKVNTAAMVAG